MRQCRECKSATAKFYPNRKVCIDCYSKYARSRYQKTKETLASTRLKKFFDFDLNEYNKRFELQGGKCAICREPPATNRRLSVDHCHKTGIVRKLLCIKCNCIIGMAGDSTEILTKAIDYLKEHT